MLYETAPAVFSYRSSSPHFVTWTGEAVLSSAVLVAGIFLEIKTSNFAKYINVGFYLYRALWGLVAVAATAAHVLGFTNESWIYFYLVSLPCLAVVIVNCLLYRKRATTSAVPMTS
jgi:hypothetical protein